MRDTLFPAGPATNVVARVRWFLATVARRRHGGRCLQCNHWQRIGWQRIACKCIPCEYQDNHCAKWGAAAPNRTGVLLPRGTPFAAAALLDALRARRVFATMGKAASLVLTANGHIMGERITNRGTLTLSIRHHDARGRAIGELVIVSGVPGRDGTPETMTLAATTVTLAPPPGEHYYYARLTQDDGTMLWSAPVRVSQQAARQP